METLGFSVAVEPFYFFKAAAPGNHDDLWFRNQMEPIITKKMCPFDSFITESL